MTSRWMIALFLVTAAACGSGEARSAPPVTADGSHPPAHFLSTAAHFRWQKGNAKRVKSLPVLDPDDPRVMQYIERFGRARMRLPSLEQCGPTIVGGIAIHPFLPSFEPLLQKLLSSHPTYARCDVVAIHHVAVQSMVATVVSGTVDEAAPSPPNGTFDRRDPISREDVELDLAGLLIECPGLGQQAAEIDRRCPDEDRLADECLVVAPRR